MKKPVNQLTPQKTMSINPFAPTYTLPEVASSGSYMKLRQGKNKIRILQDPIAGYLYWNEKNKPVRLKESPVEVPTDIRRDEDGKADRVKHFWAVVVWSYASECVCILEITQSTIQKHILALVQSDWGSPLDYDLEITRTGEKLETEYTVLNLPPKPVPAAATKSLKERPVNLMALFDGSDPFANTNEKIWKQWATGTDALTWAATKCNQGQEELIPLFESIKYEADKNQKDWRSDFMTAIQQISSGDTDF